MNKIMLVEDDESLGTVLKTFLEKHNFEVVWAKNADEAFANLAPDIKLFLLDITLPGDVSGFGILKKIKEFGSPWRSVPTVMLTNEGDMEYMDRALSFGASDYIIKSNINLDKLRAYMKDKFGLE